MGVRFTYLATSKSTAHEHLSFPLLLCLADENDKRHRRRGRPGADPPDFKTVGFDFNPGHDAEERLRRLFIILLKLADDELPQPGTGSPPDDGSGEEEA